MQLLPALKLGWLNGWIPLGLLVLVEGLMLLAAPHAVRRRLFDRSTWGRKQAVLTALGKLSSLVCLVLLVLTPLKVGTPVFAAGLTVYAVGLAALIVAILDFQRTPLGQPVSRGLYRLSHHPQIVALLVAFWGMCLAIGSWAALLALLLSRVLQHWGILAEEEACLAQYGQSYAEYLERVPRYFLFF